MGASKYKVLLTAVDLGSFSAAAQKLGYTQSGLTHMMNTLEGEVGFPILQRGYYGIKLTPAGERLIPRIRALVNCEDALENEIDIVRSYGDKVIRIGAFSSIAETWLPTIVQRLEKEIPGVTVNIQTGTVAEVFGGLEEGRFDLCYGSRNPKYNFRWIPLFTDRFYAVLPKDYPTEGEEFPISGFNGTKFLMPGLGFDDDIGAVFAERGVRPFVTQTYVDDPAIISMVEHNLGISMLSELIVNGRKNAVRIVPIVPAVSRTLAIAMKPDSAPSVPQKRLISLTKEFVKEYKIDIFGHIE